MKDCGSQRQSAAGLTETGQAQRVRDGELRTWVYAAPSTIHGTGLFAARRIEKGEYIGTYHGPAAKRNGMYVLWIYPDDPPTPVGISGRNLLRYMNHARPGSVELDGPDVYARRTIAKDREITFDYGPDW